MSQDTNDLVKSEANELVAEMFTDQVLDMYEQYRALKEQKEIFEYKVAQACAKHGINSLKTTYWDISYTPEHEQKRVDTEKVKNTDIYVVDEDTGEFRKAREDEFIKTSTVKESVRIKLK